MLVREAHPIVLTRGQDIRYLLLHLQILYLLLALLEEGLSGRVLLKEVILEQWVHD